MSLGTPLGKGRESEGSKEAAVIREIMTGEALKRQITEKQKEQDAAKEACQMRGHKSVGSLGKCVAAIPQMEYIHLCQKYGRDEVHSKGFMQYFNRKFPHLSPNKA